MHDKKFWEILSIFVHMFVTPATLLILRAGLYQLTSTEVKLPLMSLLMASFLKKQMIICEYESKPQ